MSDFKLRSYQVQNSQRGVDVLRELGIVYYSMECRSGKTLTSLECARLFGAKKVAFLTKKKAVSSVLRDYKLLNPGYFCDVINDESFHLIDEAYRILYRMVSRRERITKVKTSQIIEKFGNDYDLVIHDEHHRFGAFAKPGIFTKVFKKRFSHLPMIFLSGTPSPESFSMLFHQFWVSDRTPFPHPTFTKWAEEYVDIRVKHVGYGTKNDYTRGIKDKILAVTDPYMIDYTQEQAGFVVKLHEHFCHVPTDPICKTIADRLLTSGVVQGKTGLISADNAAALQQKIHQVHSGTIILDADEDGSRRSVVLSDAKAKFIATTWPNEKLVIFYQFKAELTAIKQVLGDRVTTDLAEFQNSDKSCAFQVVSGREGIDLSLGELIVFYNISHSATSYFQARDRLTTSTRLESHIYWLFSDHGGIPGIEAKIYDVVQGKKKYTAAHFRRDFNKCLSPKFKAKSSKNMSRMATLSSK